MKYAILTFLSLLLAYSSFAQVQLEYNGTQKAQANTNSLTVFDGRVFFQTDSEIGSRLWAYDPDEVAPGLIYFPGSDDGGSGHQLISTYYHLFFLEDGITQVRRGNWYAENLHDEVNSPIEQYVRLPYELVVLTEENLVAVDFNGNDYNVLAPRINRSGIMNPLLVSDGEEAFFIEPKGDGTSRIFSFFKYRRDALVQLPDIDFGDWAPVDLTGVALDKEILVMSADYGNVAFIDKETGVFRRETLSALDYPEINYHLFGDHLYLPISDAMNTQRVVRYNTERQEIDTTFAIPADGATNWTVVPIGDRLFAWGFAARGTATTTGFYEIFEDGTFEERAGIANILGYTEPRADLLALLNNQFYFAADKKLIIFNEDGTIINEIPVPSLIDDGSTFQHVGHTNDDRLFLLGKFDTITNDLLGQNNSQQIILFNPNNKEVEPLNNYLPNLHHLGTNTLVSGNEALLSYPVLDGTSQGIVYVDLNNWSTQVLQDDPGQDTLGFFYADGFHSVDSVLYYGLRKRTPHEIIQYDLRNNQRQVLYSSDPNASYSWRSDLLALVDTSLYFLNMDYGQDGDSLNTYLAKVDFDGTVTKLHDPDFPISSLQFQASSDRVFYYSGDNTAMYNPEIGFQFVEYNGNPIKLRPLWLPFLETDTTVFLTSTSAIYTLDKRTNSVELLRQFNHPNDEWRFTNELRLLSLHDKVIYFSSSARRVANQEFIPQTLFKYNLDSDEILLIGDFPPHSAYGSRPDNLIWRDSTLFLTVSTAAYGRELWSYRPDCDNLEASISTAPDSMHTLPNGSVEISVSGGTAPYTINWQNGATGTLIDELGGGRYDFTVVDSEGCPLSSFAWVETVLPVRFTATDDVRTAETGLLVYPNPTTGLLALDFESTTLSGNIHLNVFDTQGRIQLSRKPNPTQQPTIDLSAFANGVYYLQLIDEDQKTVLVQKVIKTE